MSFFIILPLFLHQSGLLLGSQPVKDRPQHKRVIYELVERVEDLEVRSEAPDGGVEVPGLLHRLHLAGEFLKYFY